SPRPRWDRTGAGRVDRSTVRVEPPPQCLEPFYELRLDGAVGTRADVQQQIRPGPGRTNEGVHEITGRLVIVIGDVEAPRAVHRERRLGRQLPDLRRVEARGIGTGQILLE